MLLVYFARCDAAPKRKAYTSHRREYAFSTARWAVSYTALIPSNVSLLHLNHLPLCRNYPGNQTLQAIYLASTIFQFGLLNGVS